jgi:hypothetical protein
LFCLIFGDLWASIPNIQHLLHNVVAWLLLHLTSTICKSPCGVTTITPSPSRWLGQTNPYTGFLKARV